VLEDVELVSLELVPVPFFLAFFLCTFFVLVVIVSWLAVAVEVF
jgi:hypothetical protein